MKQIIEVCPECGCKPELMKYHGGFLRWKCANPDCSHPVKTGDFSDLKTASTVWNGRVRDFIFMKD